MAADLGAPRADPRAAPARALASAVLLALGACQVAGPSDGGGGEQVCALRSMCLEAIDDLEITVVAEGTEAKAILDADEVLLRLETLAVRADEGRADLTLSATGCVDIEFEGEARVGPYDVRWALTCLLQVRSMDLPPGTTAADACLAESANDDGCVSPRPFYLGMTVSLDAEGWLDDSSCWWDPYSPWSGCGADAAHVEGAIDVGDTGFGASLRFGDGCFPSVDFEQDYWQLFEPVPDPAACAWPDPGETESDCG